MRVRVALAVVGMLIGGGLLLVHLFGLTVACSFDTSYCAASSEKNGAYTGQLFTSGPVPEPSVDGSGSQPLRPGAPYANATFLVRFESRSDDDLPLVAFHTDGAGEFCVVWAKEAITPFVEGESGEMLLARYPSDARSLPPDDLPLTGSLRYWEEGVPAGCETSDEGIPWNRAADLDSAWQSWILWLLPTGAIALLAAALVRRHHASAGPLLIGGLSLLGVAAAALLVLWGFL